MCDKFPDNPGYHTLGPGRAEGDSMRQMNWNVTKEDNRLIKTICKRAVTLWPDADYLNVTMDVTATHLNGCPLDLKKLLNADDFNFAHDMGGIASCLDRKTGKLTKCFLPRCSA